VIPKGTWSDAHFTLALSGELRRFVRTPGPVNIITTRHDQPRRLASRPTTHSRLLAHVANVHYQQGC
jgi:hypothetical protein